MFSLILINQNQEMQSPVFFRNHQQYWTYGSKTMCTPNRQSIIVVMTNRRYTTWEWWVFEWSQFCCYCYCYCRTTVSPLFNRSTCWGARITIANSWLWSLPPTEDRRMDSWIYCYCQVWRHPTSLQSYCGNDECRVQAEIFIRFSQYIIVIGRVTLKVIDIFGPWPVRPVT